MANPDMFPNVYASGRNRPFAFHVRHGVTVPGSEGHTVRKQASFADLHSGGFMTGDKAVPVDIDLFANGDCAFIAASP